MGPRKNPKNAHSRFSTRSPAAGGIAAAAGILGIPARTVRAAKRAGCPAFRWSRVHLDELTAWLEANPVLPRQADSELDAARLAKLNEQVRKLKLANDEVAGRLIDRDKVAAALASCCADWNVARVRFEAEAPAEMARLEADACRVVVRRMMDEVGRVLAGCARHFGGADA